MNDTSWWTGWSDWLTVLWWYLLPLILVIAIARWALDRIRK